MATGCSHGINSSLTIALCEPNSPDVLNRSPSRGQGKDIKFSWLAANVLPAVFYAAGNNACFSIGVSTPKLRCTRLVL